MKAAKKAKKEAQKALDAADSEDSDDEVDKKFVKKAAKSKRQDALKKEAAAVAADAVTRTEGKDKKFTAGKKADAKERAIARIEGKSLDSNVQTEKKSH
jgi:hypothetical protein